MKAKISKDSRLGRANVLFSKIMSNQSSSCDTPCLHSVSKCPISFGNCFWHLIVGNRSIVLNFYQQRPVFALKNHPRPQRPKRPMKANKDQNSPKLQISLLLSLFNVKSSTNVNKVSEKCVFKKLKISISTT